MTEVEKMVEEQIRSRGVTAGRVLEAMLRVPRHEFMPATLRSRAYSDQPLPIGRGQTISQPYVVARMIELLLSGRQALGKTLEVGAGCGYQAAVLGSLSRQVYAVERLAPLLAQARENLRLAKLSHVRLKHANGMFGLAEAAPFDTIVVAAAAPSVPKALLDQLAPGGRLMLPVGVFDQVLCLFERMPEGFAESRFDPVRFVPLLPGVE